jgi:hypothetical protein
MVIVYDNDDDDVMVLSLPVLSRRARQILVSINLF